VFWGQTTRSDVRSLCRARVAFSSFVFAVFAVALGAAPATAAAPGDTDGPRATPRAGRAFHTTVADTPVALPAYDRGHITSWDLGVATSTTPQGVDVLPLLALYLFHRTDEQLLRAVVAVVSNEVLLTRPWHKGAPAEWLLSASMLAPPVALAPRVDDVDRPRQELLSGELRAGLGLGARGRAAVAPGEQADVDNMWEANVTVEPVFRWFFPGERAAPDFVAPASHRALQVHGALRFDGLTRNLFGSNHAGVAFGVRATAGVRAGVTPWSGDHAPSTMWQRGNAWLVGVAPVGPLPEQHRLLYSLHGAFGLGLDRFTAFAVGGGPPRDETFAQDVPLLPGASIDEYPTTRHLIGSLEYRHEPIFFFYWGPFASVAILDREHELKGHVVRTDDVVSAAGLRMTTVFLFSSRIQLQYGINTGLLQTPSAPRQELTVHLSGRL